MWLPLWEQYNLRFRYIGPDGQLDISRWISSSNHQSCTITVKNDLNYRYTFTPEEQSSKSRWNYVKFYIFGLSDGNHGTVETNKFFSLQKWSLDTTWQRSPVTTEMHKRNDRGSITRLVFIFKPTKVHKMCQDQPWQNVKGQIYSFTCLKEMIHSWRSFHINHDVNCTVVMECFSPHKSLSYYTSTLKESALETIKIEWFASMPQENWDGSVFLPNRFWIQWIIGPFF